VFEGKILDLNIPGLAQVTSVLAPSHLCCPKDAAGPLYPHCGQVSSSLLWLGLTLSV
jgi:hypothetical protein